jgi:ATP-binding protein involved in chromosome partitioning
MVAVSSGKGGVGKSTVSVNLAVATAAEGLRVGLMDTDIYGPNLPGMLGVHQRPEVVSGTQRIRPAEVAGLRLISMGMLVDAGVPVIWRGPMLAKMVTQFLFSVEWGQLDVLVLDLPPGTGDVQLTLTQTAPLTGAVIVTTPSTLALEDVARGVQMFRQTAVPILGLVENMISFECSACGHQSHPFGQGGGESAAVALDIPYLGGVPLDLDVRVGADTGSPAVTGHPELPASQALRQIARSVLQRLDA